MLCSNFGYTAISPIQLLDHKDKELKISSFVDTKSRKQHNRFSDFLFFKDSRPSFGFSLNGLLIVPVTCHASLYSADLILIDSEELLS